MGSPGPGEEQSGEDQNQNETENEAGPASGGGRKMFHLRVTEDAKLAVTKFVSALDMEHDAFLRRLEAISAPFRPAAYLNYCSFETEGGSLERRDLSTMTEAEARQWADDFVAGLGERLPEYESWSYRFSNVATAAAGAGAGDGDGDGDGSEGSGRKMMDGDWRALDRPEDLRAMFNEMRDNELAPAFIRVRIPPPPYLPSLILSKALLNCTY